MEYSGMGVWGATREPNFFLALCISNTTTEASKKHLCWPKEYGGMGVWVATPEPKQYFLVLYISNTTIPRI